MRDRIIDLISFLGISQKKFAETIGITAGGLTDYIKGRSKDLSSSTIARIAEQFNVNGNWLLTGVGEMFIGQNEKTISIQNNLNLMKEIIESVENYCNTENLYIPPERKANIIIYLYNDISENSNTTADKIEGKVNKIIKLAI